MTVTVTAICTVMQNPNTLTALQFTTAIQVCLQNSASSYMICRHKSEAKESEISRSPLSAIRFEIFIKRLICETTATVTHSAQCFSIH